MQRSLSTNFVQLANEGHGEHRASREAGDGAHCGRDGRKFYQNPVGGEVVARRAGSIHTRLSEKFCRSILFFFTGARCSNQAEKNYVRGAGCFSFPRLFVRVHTKSQAWLLFVRKYLTNEKNTKRGRNREKTFGINWQKTQENKSREKNIYIYRQM